jgi:hypothetical protein
MRRLLLIFVAALALCTSIAGPVATSQAASTNHLVVGMGTVSLGSPYGSPTLSVLAFQTGTRVTGGFVITYPADATYPAGRTAVIGTVTCLDVSGDIAYITGLIAVSSGPRAGIFPVGDHIAIGVQAHEMNFSAGLSSGPCAPEQSADIPLTAGSFIVR